MHQLPCPNCQAPIVVSPAQAGEETACPDCGAAVALPTLGQLRKLPRAESASADPPPAEAAAETSAGLRAAFVALGLIATASGLIAAFCAVRWALIEVPMTTDRHIAELRSQYEELSAAELVREWEDIEEHGVEMVAPFQYRRLQLTRQRWGRNALIAASLCLLAVLGAAILGAATRRKRGAPPADT